MTRVLLLGGPEDGRSISVDDEKRELKFPVRYPILCAAIPIPTKVKIAVYERDSSDGGVFNYGGQIMKCTKCGGDMLGDGYESVLHCENANEVDYEFHEPDSGPVYCNFEEDDGRYFIEERG